MLIDGPVNIVRIEGSINNVNKVLYVLFDYHNPLHEQTQCESYDSVNITKLLYNIFKNISHKLDFFLEIRQIQYSRYDSTNYNKMYIHENIKLYNQIKDKKFKNTRFHYMDIRDVLLQDIANAYEWFVFNDPIREIRINRIVYLDTCDLYLHYSKLIKKRLLFIKTNLVEVNKSEYKQKLKKMFINGKKTTEQLLYYTIYKLYYRYNHDDIFIKFRNEYTKQILEYIEICLNNIKLVSDLLLSHKDFIKDFNNKKFYYNDSSKIDELYSHKKYDINDDIIYRLDKLTSYIQNNLVDIFLLLTDLFFIRRFVDKDYINFGISYTGGKHSINYLYNLIKFFNFKITHASHSDVSTDKLNALAKTDNIYNFGYQLETNNIQCSNITLFPKELI